jgi:hypothetical protein
LSAVVNPGVVKDIERAKLLLVEGRLGAARAALDHAHRLGAATENVGELEDVIKVARAATKGTAALTFRSFEELERSARRDLEELQLRGRSRRWPTG